MIAAAPAAHHAAALMGAVLLIAGAAAVELRTGRLAGLLQAARHRQYFEV